MKILLPAILLFSISCNNKKKGDSDNKPVNADTTITTVEPKPDSTVPSLPSTEEKAVTAITAKWRPVEVNLKEANENEKKDIIANASIEMTADGKYISIYKEDKEMGTYTYDEKAKTLVTRSPNGDTENFSVEWIGDNLKLINKEGTIIFIRSVE